MGASMRLGWYSDLKRGERNTFFACFGGLALDAMDSQMFALVIPTLIATAGITKGEAGIMSSLALIGSGLGGWMAGALADRFGRVRLLQLTILWVALWTFAAAFTNGFAQLAFARTMQGIGYGGEAAVGAVLVSEMVSPAMRGRVAAAVQSGFAVGYALAVCLFPIVFSMAPEALAWRIFFGLGLLPAVFVIFIRRLTPESPVYLRAEAAETAALAANSEHKRAKGGLVAIFKPEHLRRTIVATLMSTGIFGGAYTILTWLPTYLREERGLSVTSTAAYLAANILGSFLGPLLFGQVADRLGRRVTFVGFLILQAINVTIYLSAPVGMPVFVVMGCILGALQGGLASGMLPTFSELFPTKIRATGQGFCLSGGRGIASVVPALVGIGSAYAPLGLAMGVCAVGSYAVGIAAAAAMPETKDVSLDD
jgi:MFS family permease